MGRESDEESRPGDECEADDCEADDCEADDCEADDCEADDCEADDCEADDCEADDCEAESGTARERSFIKLGVRGVLWTISLLTAALILYLSWVPDSHLRLVRWIPGWLAEWADSGGRVENMRTGVPLVIAGLLFSLSWRVSGIRHWALGGIGLALLLVLLAEGGQHFRPARKADWGDVWWGVGGALAGVILCVLFALSEKIVLNLSKNEIPPDG